MDKKIYNYLKDKRNNIKEFIRTANEKLKEKSKQQINYLNDINNKKFNKISTVFEKLQDKLDESITNETEDVLLKQSPFWAKSITWTLMAGTVMGFAWLATAKTEEIVIAQGQLEPTSGVLNVQMPLRGVASEILVKEGQKVQKGEVLIKLDTEISEAKRTNKLESLKINQTILNKLELLMKEGAIAEIQYLQQKEKVSSIKSQLVESDVTLKYQEILSPSEGYVFDLKPKAKGFVANSSEPILKIVPTDDLQAVVEIDSRTIGFVKVGSLASISIDSYPSTDFGIIEGEVIRIGSDALDIDPSTGKGIRFPTKIKLNNQNLITNRNKELPLQVGMSVTANIKLRKVSYLKLLLNTFSEKADSIREI